MTLFFSDYLYFVISFFNFWYTKAPVSLISYFASLNTSVSRALSLQILISSFFKPWKNEYRKDLITFAIVIGIFIKSILIFFDLVILIILFVLEIMMIILFLIWPVLTIYWLFK